MQVSIPASSSAPYRCDRSSRPRRPATTPHQIQNPEQYFEDRKQATIKPTRIGMIELDSDASCNRNRQREEAMLGNLRFKYCDWLLRNTSDMSCRSRAADCTTFFPIRWSASDADAWLCDCNPSDALMYQGLRTIWRGEFLAGLFGRSPFSRRREQGRREEGIPRQPTFRPTAWISFWLRWNIWVIWPVMISICCSCSTPPSNPAGHFAGVATCDEKSH